MSGEKEQAPLNCTRYLDLLYFCYSPVWQVSQLYKQGELDSCTGTWGRLADCLKLKAKPDPEVRALLEAADAQPCLWQLREPEEARVFWADQFPRQAPQAQAAEAQAPQAQQALPQTPESQPPAPQPPTPQAE